VDEVWLPFTCRKCGTKREAKPDSVALRESICAGCVVLARSSQGSKA
jgi:hypothetical protein